MKTFLKSQSYSLISMSIPLLSSVFRINSSFATINQLLEPLKRILIFVTKNKTENRGKKNREKEFRSMNDHEIYLSKLSVKSFNHLENQTYRIRDILTFSVWRNRKNSADENRPRSMFFDRRDHRLAWWLYCDVSTINQYDSRRMTTPLRSSANSLARAYAATIEARNLMNKKEKGLRTKNVSSKHCGYTAYDL